MATLVKGEGRSSRSLATGDSSANRFDAGEIDCVHWLESGGDVAWPRRVPVDESDELAEEIGS